MNKHCVFCGEKPENKSKEHVVPRWLIKLTGKANRKASFGFIKDIQNGDIKERIFAFDKFTFPACSICNHKYSDLEARAKIHICNILDGNKLDILDLSDLLDWFDKVRVGIWLGMRQLDKNIANIEPNFHIEKRIGQYDRMLIVEKSDFKSSRLNMGGTDTGCFTLTPSSLLLIINGYYFTSISSMYLCSRRLGFPYSKSTKLHSERNDIEVDLVEGNGRVMLPVLRKHIAEAGARYFQPMFKGGLTEGELPYYDSEYVKSHSIDAELGIGNIFKETLSGIIELKNGDSTCLEPEIIQEENQIYLNSAINILEWQIWLHSDLPNMTLLTTEQRKYIRNKFKEAEKYNKILINSNKFL